MSQQQQQTQQPRTLPLFLNMLTGGFSACVAEAFTIPLDTAKVRLQLQSKGGDTTHHYKGVGDCLSTMVKEEGLKSLWAGIGAGFQRQIVFASLRLGLYEPIRNFYSGGSKESTLGIKIMAGLSTGTIGMIVANPTDLVKIRLQAQGIAARKDPTKIKYTSLLNAYTKIFKEEGLLAFWTGVGPNILRNSIINATELSVFDQSKQMFQKNNILEDGVPCHLVCSSIAGFCATVIGSPVDVIKTRIMNANGLSVVGVVSSLIKEEGFKAFYNGFTANAQRIITWNICMFVTWEQVKKVTSKSYYKE